MAWTDSRVFRAYVTDLVDNTTAMDWVTDASVKAALFGTSITPDKDVASASSAYNTGVWTSGSEIADGANWAAGGVALTSRTITNPSSGIIQMSAANTPSTTSTATLSAVFGCLVYDDTIGSPVADQGFCFNYFGGTNSVTSGTFTIVWHANGVFRATV